MASDRPADIPAGHKRDEARRVVADELAAKIEENEARDDIHALDETKLNRRDNEIVRHVEDGSVPIQGAQPGYRYAWVTVAGSYRESGARANIRMMHDVMKRAGYEAVSGNNPAGQEFEGNDEAAGTTLRGVGDCILFQIREEDYQALQRRNAEKQQRQQAVEQNRVVWANQELTHAGLPPTMHGGAGNFTDPVMSRAFGSQGQSIVYTANAAEERALREGTMKVGGETVQPGFERRR